MKVIAANSRASYDYDIEQRINAGIVLTGSEVKSLRFNTGSIKGAHIIEKNGELWITNFFIKNYINSKNENYDPIRKKKLLLSRKEINKVAGQIKLKGISIIPISLFFNEKGFVKLNFGLGKGKRKFDKRQSIKQKDWNIKKERILKNK